MKSLLTMINNDIPSIYSGHQPFNPGYHYQSYILFHQLSRELDFPLFFCSPYDYDWSNGTIRGWWELEDDHFIPWEEPFLPEFIFDKATGADPHCSAVIEHCESRGITIFSPPDLARLCGDKWRIYLHFSKYSPLTALLTQDRSRIVHQISSFFDEMDRMYTHHDNRVVVKPLHGFQSRGIHLISRTPAGLEMNMLFGGQIHDSDVDRNLHMMTQTPYLIQAWVNTGGGIPGVGLEGSRHDVRFIFRIPQIGLAEFILLYVKTLNGMKYVPLDQFELSDPFEVVNPIADWIASHFPYGIFSVDVMRDITGTWFLTELNDQVGLTIDFNSEEEIQEMIRFMGIYIQDMKRIHQDNME